MPFDESRVWARRTLLEAVDVVHDFFPIVDSGHQEVQGEDQGQDEE